MRRIIPFVLILTAALCFNAGYTVGKRNATIVVRKPATAPAATPVETDSEVMADTGSEPEALIVEAPDPTESATPSPDTAQLAQRAQQQFITLTDSQERSIQVEVLEATETHLKVRRQSDLRIVQIPLHMLSADDQAFAAYLWEKENHSFGGKMGKEAEQKMLEELFGAF